MRDLKADLENVKKVIEVNESVKPFERDDFMEDVNILSDWHFECADVAKYAIEQALAEKERADKYEALVRELLDVMMSVAYQECGYEENGITKFDSMAIGARMELLLTLIKHGRLEEIYSFGRRVIAKLPGAKEALRDE